MSQTIPALQPDQLNAKQVEELTGVHRNQWSTRMAGGFVPKPDGYIRRHPWWWRSTIDDFMTWNSDPVLSKAPTKMERFAAWREQRRAESQPVDQSEEDEPLVLITERSIRNHRSFQVDELTEELRALIPRAGSLVLTEGDTLQVVDEGEVELT